MHIKLECPICESQFQIAEDSSPVMSICPECNREFKTSDAIIESSSNGARNKLILPEQVLETGKPAKSDSTLPASVSASSSLAPTSATQSPSEVEHGVKMGRRQFAKKPSKAVPLAIIGLLALIAISLLVYLPIVINQNKALAEKAASQPQTTSPDANEVASDGAPSNQPASGPTTEPISNSNKKTDIVEEQSKQQIATDKVLAGFGEQEEITPVVDVVESPLVIEETPTLEPEPKRDPKPAPDQKLVHFDAADLEDFWREHHTRVVRLTAFNALGETQALGTIIDSRGWIVTSYRAMVGAKEIRVTQTASSYDQFENGNLLTDTARGVLAVDPENDLVILAVNRRFVVNFSDLKIATKDNLEPDTHLAQFSLVDHNTPVVIRETRVSVRSSTATIAAQAKALFEKTGLNSEDRRWIEHTNQKGVVGGSPLFSIEGELVGISTEQPDTETSFAVSATPIHELLERIKNDPKTDNGRMPRDLSVLSEKVDSVGKENLAEEKAVDVNNPFRKSVIEFNKVGDACTAFAFSPADVEQYKLLQSFVQQMVELNITIYSIDTDPDSPAATVNQKYKDELIQLRNRWLEDFKAAFLETDIDKQHIESFNRLVADTLADTIVTEGEPVFFVAYVRVRLGAIDSPKQANGEDTITLNIDETKEILSVGYQDRFPAMLPDTLWLSIFTVDSPGKVIFNIPGTKRRLKASPASIQWLPRKAIEY